MKRVFLTLAIAMLAVTSYAQNNSNSDKNYIEITGKATLETTPDEIYVGIVISEKDNKGKVSVEQQQSAMFKALTAAGINVEKDLEVQDFSADLQTYLLKKNSPVSTKSYQLKVANVETLDKVFQALTKIGISDININRTDISNMEQLQQNLAVQAAKNAHESAKLLAAAVGQKVGKAIYIQDYGYNARPYPMVMMAKSAAFDQENGESALQLQFQKSKIEHSVLIRFALE